MLLKVNVYHQVADKDLSAVDSTDSLFLVNPPICLNCRHKLFTY